MLYFEKISLKDFSEIVKMVAVAVGGLWAAWTFHKLQKVRAAELKNRQTEVEIQKSRAEHEELRMRVLRQQPQLAVELRATETASSTKGYKSFLCITVVLKNEGEQNLDLQFSPTALTVGRLTFHKNGEQAMSVQRFGASYFDENEDQPQLFHERILRVGQKRQMALAVLPVAQPAGYIIQFRAAYSRPTFDGERLTAKPFTIEALEQMIYFATGNPSEPAEVDSTHE